MPVADGAPLVGKAIANYKILSELGRGGMGVVYKAMDVTLQRPVAIKVLPDKFAQEETLVKRFLREARSAAVLNHPNVVTVYGVGRHENQYYIALEFVDGMPLDAVIAKEKRIPPRRAVEMLRQAADALAIAHAHQIIHRDIKPQNIMIDKTGRVRVMDFGLALALTDEVKLTQEGMSVGTALYMSPEQWQDTEIDARSDIYSLGATFYEMLTGVAPFNASTPAAIVQKVFNQPTPTLKDAGVACDQWVEEILAKMVAKDRNNRYDSAEALCRDLDAYLASGSSSKAALEFAPVGVAEELERMDKKVHRSSQSMPTPAITAPIPEEPKSRRTLYIGAAVLVTVAVLGAAAIFMPSGDPGFGTQVFAKDDFIAIPAGSFVLGSPATEAGRSDDEAQHNVTLSKGFWMGKHEVTQAQWTKVMGTNPSHFAGEDLPVENVSWDDVQEFLSKLAALEGVTFRLPTEAEWEYACRAGNTTAYSFGDSAALLDQYAWHAGNSGRTTHPAGSTEPNLWGLYDMHGNVWEWCQDFLGVYPVGLTTDPKGPGAGIKHVGRGGSFAVESSNCRSADRSASDPSTKGADLGFRICRD